MTIDAVHLRNFKLFQRADVRFRRLTLLTGTNSSGKSTIIHAITSILQTQLPHQFPFELDVAGQNCSLGSFREIVHGRSSRRSFGVGLEFRNGKTRGVAQGSFRYSASGNQLLPDRLSFRDDDDTLELRWQGGKGGYAARQSTSKFANWMTSDRLLAVMQALEPGSADQKSRKADTPALVEVRRYLDEARDQMGQWFSLEGRKPADLIRDLRQRPFVHISLSTLEKAMQWLAQNTSYIGPVRAYPARYYLAGESSARVDPKGTNAIAILYEWKRHYPKRFAEVLALLQQLQLANRVDAQASLEEILRLDVQPFGHSELVNLADVGFGVSQILPVLIADVALPENGTLIVNQPEVHLHPSSQALLADYLVSRLKVRQYIVETHSEYLVNRLRVLASAEPTPSEDISILYLEKRRNRINPTIHNITIDRNGALVGAPRSFFETYFLDSFHLAMAGFEG